MNANKAWFNLFNKVKVQGGEVAPRGRPTFELLHEPIRVDMLYPVVTVRPRLNHRFMAAEALWIIEGRDDLEPLARHVPRMAEFSDDGRTLAGAYGPSIRRQLRYVVEKLREDRDTRQAALTVWRPNPMPSKDIPCLAGSTEIWSPEGNILISALARKFSRGEISRYPVLSFKPETRKINLAWCTNAWRTGTKPTLEIHFDDGSSLRCTEDHILYQKIRYHVDGDLPKSSRTFVHETCAKNLRVGDKLWAATMLKTGKMHRPAYLHDLSMNWHYNNQHLLHQKYAEFLWGSIPDGYDVHHKNDNVNDNRKDNLEVIPHDYHASLNMFGDQNPARRETIEANTKRRLKLRETWVSKGYNVKPIEYYPNNHKIIGITKHKPEPVYDFTVPGKENAVVGTGIIAHNCTVAMVFQIRDDLFNAHVFMRSSDVWLGLPYDIFSFTMIAEWVRLHHNLGSAAVRAGPGELFVTAASSHLYQEDLEGVVCPENLYHEPMPGWRSPDDLASELRQIERGGKSWWR